MEAGNGLLEGRSILKVSGGKTIRVWCRYRGETVEQVRFSGDFFMHPEEALEDLESRLHGVDVSRACEIIVDFLTDVELFGAAPEDFTEALRMALRGS